MFQSMKFCNFNLEKNWDFEIQFRITIWTAVSDLKPWSHTELFRLFSHKGLSATNDVNMMFNSAARLGKFLSIFFSFLQVPQYLGLSCCITQWVLCKKISRDYDWFHYSLIYIPASVRFFQKLQLNLGAHSCVTDVITGLCTPPRLIIGRWTSGSCTLWKWWTTTKYGNDALC